MIHGKIFSYLPLWQREGVALVRIITGAFLIYHGWEVFDEQQMHEYAAWDIFQNRPKPLMIVYIGKGSELLAGVLLALGLFTRIGCFIIACTFIYISFFVGNGKIWYEDQHPFMFVLLAFMFFFTGPGRWSVDSILFQKQKVTFGRE